MTRLLILMVVLAFSCQPRDHSQALKPIADNYVEAWNTGDFSDLDNIIHPDYVRSVSPTSNSSAVGLDSLKSVIGRFRTAYPDLKVELLDETYTENRSVARWKVTATNTGPGAFPATGKAVELEGITIFDYSEGKIIKEWASFDNLHFMSQQGFALIPPAPPLENDPVKVDADHYKLEFENELVRILRIKYGPKEKSVMHDHYSGVVVFLRDSKGQFTLPDGSTVQTSGKAGDVQWAPAGAHLPENTSNNVLEVILVELKGK